VGLAITLAVPKRLRASHPLSTAGIHSPAMEPVHVRRAVAEDWPFILALIPRLTELGPEWRDRAQMAATEARAVAESLNGGDPDRAVFIAEDGQARLGFIELWTLVDYFTGERHGHVSNIVVARESERRGVGAALIATAETWCRERGYPMLTLHVFDANHGARALYERSGFTVEMLRYIKPL
jgi:ribosomal protein S18 acetylase RimI-like enzyme